MASESSGHLYRRTSGKAGLLLTGYMLTVGQWETDIKTNWNTLTTLYVCVCVCVCVLYIYISEYFLQPTLLWNWVYSLSILYLKPRERKPLHVYIKWGNASEWQFSSVLREIFVVLKTERGDQKKKKKVVCICVYVRLIFCSLHPLTWSKIALKFVQHNLTFIIMQVIMGPH